MKTEYGGLMYGVAAAIFIKSILLPEGGKFVYLGAVVIGGSIGFLLQKYQINKSKRKK